MSNIPPYPTDMPRLGEVDPQTHQLRVVHIPEEPGKSPRSQAVSGPIGPVDEKQAKWKNRGSPNPHERRTPEWITRRIEERPIPSVLVGLGFGALLGLIVGGSR